LAGYSSSSIEDHPDPTPPTPPEPYDGVEEGIDAGAAGDGAGFEAMGAEVAGFDGVLFFGAALRFIPLDFAAAFRLGAARRFGAAFFRAAFLALDRRIGFFLPVLFLAFLFARFFAKLPPPFVTRLEHKRLDLEQAGL
jgi:hypothetical protein